MFGDPTYALWKILSTLSNPLNEKQESCGQGVYDLKQMLEWFRKGMPIQLNIHSMISKENIPVPFPYLYYYKLALALVHINMMDFRMILTTVQVQILLLKD